MEKQETINNLFLNNLPIDRINERIEYYIRNLLQYNKEIYFEKFDGKLPFDSYITLLEDNPKMSKEKHSKRHRRYSLFIFTFLDMDKLNCLYDCLKGEKLKKDIQAKIQNYIFDTFFKDLVSLKVNSYVYSVMIITSLNSSVKDKYLTYYLNENYLFKVINSKKIINRKVDINEISHFITNINDTLNKINKEQTELLNLCKAFLNKLDMYESTEYFYDKILKSLKRHKHVFVDGVARSGKSIIANKIAGLFDNSILYLMNAQLYFGLMKTFKYLDSEYKDGCFSKARDRIFHYKHDEKDGFFNADKLIEKRPSIFIIDESQRISERLQDQIISYLKSNKNAQLLFLGDEMQKLNPSLDKGIDRIIDYLDPKSYVQYDFSYPVSLPYNLIITINYLLNIRTSSKGITNSKFKINIFNDKNKFMTAFNEDSTSSKRYTSIYFYKVIPHEVDASLPNRYDKCQNAEDDYSLYNNDNSKYSSTFTPYEVISTELENIYIYLPEEIKVVNNKLVYIPEKQDIRYYKMTYQHYVNLLSKYLIYQLYVLMTRGQNSINIFASNPDVYTYFSNKLTAISNNGIDIKEIHNELKNQADELENILISKNINRLVYITPISAEKLYKDGIEIDNSNTYRDNVITLYVNDMPDIDPSILLTEMRGYVSYHGDYSIAYIKPELLYNNFINDNKQYILPKCKFINSNKEVKPDDFIVDGYARIKYDCKIGPEFIYDIKKRKC